MQFSVTAGYLIGSVGVHVELVGNVKVVQSGLEHERLGLRPGSRRAAARRLDQMRLSAVQHPRDPMPCRVRVAYDVESRAQPMAFKSPRP